MNATKPIHPHDRFLILAGLLTMSGLSLGLAHVLWSSPYTMVLFLGPGQMAIVAGASIFLVVLALDLRSRLQSVVERNFDRGEIVFRQGDYPDRLYLIGRGEAEVILEAPDGEERQMAVLKKGEFFGEMGIVGNTPRSATVRAATSLETLSIHRNYMEPIFSYLPSWKEKVGKEYARRTAMNLEAERKE